MKKSYKFEAHAHTAESSACAFITASELVGNYHAAGYDGVVITDHLYAFMTTPYCDWEVYIDHLLRGYKAAKKRGKKLGMEILLGMEIRFDNVNSDFLVYGIDEDFLRANPHLNQLNPREFYKRFGDELLIIQAHPCRDHNDAHFTDAIHGIEVFNGNPRHNNNNKRAQALYAANPHYYTLAGSDTHQPGDVGTGWVAFDQPVTTSKQFCDLVKQRAYSHGRG